MNHLSFGHRHIHAEEDHAHDYAYLETTHLFSSILHDPHPYAGYDSNPTCVLPYCLVRAAVLERNWWKQERVVERWRPLKLEDKTRQNKL